MNNNFCRDTPNFFFQRAQMASQNLQVGFENLQNTQMKGSPNGLHYYPYASMPHHFGREQEPPQVFDEQRFWSNDDFVPDIPTASQKVPYDKFRENYFKKKIETEADVFREWRVKNFG